MDKITNLTKTYSYIILHHMEIFRAKGDRIPLTSRLIVREPSVSNPHVTILSLPGIEHYIPNPNISTQEIESRFDVMAEEITFEAKAEYESAYIAQAMGWNTQQTEIFFSDPDRKPFKSKIALSPNFQERAQQFVVVGR